MRCARKMPRVCVDFVATGQHHEENAAAPRKVKAITRDWTPIGAVTLNPERDSVIQAHSGDNPIQQLLHE